MRWISFAVVAALLLTMQTAVAPFLAIRGVRPDWLLVGVVYFALYARAADAVIAAWALGFCADLMTLERLGLISLSYALAAMAVIYVREYLFRHRPLTQFSVTLIVCLAVQSAWLIYRRFAYGPTKPLWSDWMSGALFVSVYTALWAPLLYRLLSRFSRLLGISLPRYSHAGLTSRESHDV